VIIDGIGGTRYMEKYSVLMSCYRNDKKEWLKLSIEAILNQTYKTDDFVIICDGPIPEELNEVLIDYETKYNDIIHVYRKEKNEGLGLALAYGLTKCKNKYVARMDADDYCVPNRCEKEMKFLSDNPDYQIVGTWEDEFEEDYNKVISVHRVPETPEEIKKTMRKRCSILHPTIIFDKDYILNNGNYHHVPLMEDYDLFMRMVIECGAKCYNFQESLYSLRVNDNLYKRRGGVKYLKIVWRFKYSQYKKKNIKLGDFIISAFTQVVVCLMPNRMRKWFYLKFLRK